jgi:hypothetical protein
MLYALYDILQRYRKVLRRLGFDRQFTPQITVKFNMGLKAVNFLLLFSAMRFVLGEFHLSDQVDLQKSLPDLPPDSHTMLDKHSTRNLQSSPQTLHQAFRCILSL